MRKLLIGTVWILLLVSGCGSTGSTSNNPPPPPPPPPATPTPALGQWVIVTQSNTIPGLQTIANFNLSSLESGSQCPFVKMCFGASTPLPVALTPLALPGITSSVQSLSPPLGNFGFPILQCPGTYVTLGSTGSLQPNCPYVDISGDVGGGTYNGVSLTIGEFFFTTSNPNGCSTSGWCGGETLFSGTISSDGTTMTGTYSAEGGPQNQQQTDAGKFFATVLTNSLVAENYIGIAASSGPPPQDGILSVTYDGALNGSSVQGSIQFTVAASTYGASLTPGSGSSVGGLFSVELNDATGHVTSGILEYIPGVNFTDSPVLDPSSNTLFAMLLNGSVLGYLNTGSIPPANALIGSVSSFTYNNGVITQVPLVTFGPAATPTASTTFCAVTCSTLGTTATPTSLSISISQPVTQGYLRVFVIDTSAPAASNCTPTNQLSACSFTNYPGSGIYVGDFNPNGPVTLTGAIPAGNTIQPTDDLEVVIVNPAGSWTGTVSWQVSYQ